MILMVAKFDDARERAGLPPEDRERHGAEREQAALTFRQVGDLVGRCARLHREMATTLERRAPEAAGEEQRELLESLVSSERQRARSLERAFDGYQRDNGGPGEDEGWIQNAPASLLEDAEQRSARLDRVPLDDLEVETAAASRLLTGFFGELSAIAPTPSQEELFESLRSLEERYDRRHSSSVDPGLV